MTVLLTHSQTEAEQVVTVPAGLDFQAFLKAIRAQVPDRRWQIAETWPA
jgi:hypothetical protein